MSQAEKDYQIMRLRTLAAKRGAKPADAQRSVAALMGSDHA